MTDIVRTPYPVTSSTTTAEPGVVLLELELEGRAPVALRFSSPHALESFTAQLKLAKLRAWPKEFQQAGPVT